LRAHFGNDTARLTLGRTTTMSAPVRIYRWSAIKRGAWITSVVIALVVATWVREKCDPNFIPPENPDAITGNGQFVLAGIFLLIGAVF